MGSKDNWKNDVVPNQRPQKALVVRTRGCVLTFGDWLTITTAVAVGIILAGILGTMLWLLFFGALLMGAAGA